MNRTIRALTPEDEPFLWEMLYQAIHVPEGQAGPPRSVLQLPELAWYVEAWGRPGDCGFLAEVEETGPVGAVWIRLPTGGTRGYGYVADDTPELSMAVMPGFRGLGTGTALLERLLASPCGAAPISLSVSADNPAVRLYRRFGFEIVGEAGGENDGSYTMKRSRR